MSVSKMNKFEYVVKLNKNSLTDKICLDNITKRQLSTYYEWVAIMDKLLMIADDLTGALDTGVAFASAGIATCVGQGDYFLHNSEAASCAVQVSVVESRHIPKEQAYQGVYEIVRKAEDCAFARIYKKTDSALRGNIGAELAAARSASGENTLYFVPAYPEMGRITKDGIHYINRNIPVAESVFGLDPFNPVTHSAVLDVIRETTTAEAYRADLSFAEYPKGIAVFDASTDEEVLRIARHLVEDRNAKLFAGCAGFANALRETLDFKKEDQFDRYPNGNLIVFCGSINPISLAQCQEAVSRGAPSFHLMHSQGYSETDTLVEGIAAAAEHNPITVFDTGSTDVSSDQGGMVIAEKVSYVIKGVLKKKPDAVTFVIGGDTLIAFIKNLEIEMVFPLGELFPGVVLSKYRYQGKWQFLISKSGGFGEKDLLHKIYSKINQRTNKIGRCIQGILW